MGADDTGKPMPNHTSFSGVFRGFRPLEKGRSGAAYVTRTRDPIITNDGRTNFWAFPKIAPIQETADVRRFRVSSYFPK